MTMLDALEVWLKHMLLFTLPLAVIGIIADIVLGGDALWATVVLLWLIMTIATTAQAFNGELEDPKVRWSKGRQDGFGGDDDMDYDID